MTIGQRIKEARKNAKLTQRELAEKSGTATGTIQQYELGKRQPRLEQLRKIALALETTVSELVEPSYWSSLSLEEWKESGGWDIPTADKEDAPEGSNIALLREIENLPEVDKALVLAMVKRLRDASGGTAAVQTSKGPYYLYSYPQDAAPQPKPEMRPDTPPTSPEDTDTTPAAPPPESTENGE